MSVPRTMDELRRWYSESGLPPQYVTRFFIGVDTSESRAFGIAKKGSSFVVYKNKGDGTRSVRYEGPSEARAVGEFYARLVQEAASQGWIERERPTEDVGADVGYRGSSVTSSSPSTGSSGCSPVVVVVLMVASLLMGMLAMCSPSCRGGGSPYSSSSSHDWDDEDDGGWHWDSDSTDWDSDW